MHHLNHSTALKQSHFFQRVAIVSDSNHDFKLLNSFFNHLICKHVVHSHPESTKNTSYYKSKASQAYCFGVMDQSHVKRTHYFPSNSGSLQLCFALVKFSLGIYVWSLFDLYFSVSHVVMINLISLQSLLAIQLHSQTLPPKLRES